MTGEANVAAEAAEIEDKEHDEFEAAFLEEAEKREGPAEVDTHDEEGAGAEDGAAGATAEDPASNSNAGAQDAADDQAGAGKEEPAGDDDQFKGWTPEAIEAYKDLQAKHNDLDHRYKSDAGRVGALQRKINNLEHDIAQIQTKPGQPSKDEITDAMATDEKWAQFSEDFPEVAEAIDSRLEAVNQKVDNTLAPVIKKQQTEAEAAELAAQQEAADEVAKVYPTWQTAVKEKDFHDWIANESPGVQALAMSDDTRDASLLISKYDDNRVANGLPTLKTDHVPAGGDTVVDNADEVAKRRARQLEDGVTVESKPAQVDPNAESGNEFENAFNAFAARKAKNRA